MSAAFLETIAARQGWPVLDAENYSRFVHAFEFTVLFFARDPVRHPESSDVAVILPELLKAFSVPVKAALVGGDIERELQGRFRFAHWPALVFLKRGEYLGAVTGVMNWREFLAATESILQGPVTQPPAFDLDAVCSPKH